MIFFAFILGLIGLSLSASFSGSETAFYRVSKLRLKLDAMENDRTARRILHFVNNPGLFVATILVGNNIANYTVSMATVLFVGAAVPKAEGLLVEISSTLLLAPFLFVYGEMFPKYLSLRAPNRIVRFLSPFIYFFYLLFLPLTSLLWLLNFSLSKMLGNSTQSIIDLSLGRQELANALNEGHKTGLLFDVQRHLANRIFSFSNKRLSQWMISTEFFPMITLDQKPAAVLEIARQHQLTELPVYEDADSFLLPVGFVRTIDLEITVKEQLDEQSKQLLYLMRTELPLQSTVEIVDDSTLLTAMIILNTMQCPFGCIVDTQRRCLGFVQTEQLQKVYLI